MQTKQINTLHELVLGNCPGNHRYRNLGIECNIHILSNMVAWVIRNHFVDDMIHTHLYKKER